MYIEMFSDQKVFDNVVYKSSEVFAVTVRIRISDVWLTMPKLYHLS